jgi:ferrous iron transport protein A
LEVSRDLLLERPLDKLIENGYHLLIVLRYQFGFTSLKSISIHTKGKVKLIVMLMKTENSVQVFPLGLAREGEHVKIVGVTSGKNLVKRLTAMGLTDGTALQVLQWQPQVGFVVRCGETRLAIGAGMAHKIMVEPLSEMTQHAH